MGRYRTHGLDFAMEGRELFESATTEQVAFRPYRPERDLRLEQCGEIERMHALGRRKLMHALKMLGEERLDFIACEIVESNFHDYARRFDIGADRDSRVTLRLSSGAAGRS